MQKVLMCAALSLGVVVSHPAVAALGDPTSYANEQVALASVAYPTAISTIAADKAAGICVPPEEQYIPSFVRDMSGRIVGMNYTIIEYVC